MKTSKVKTVHRCKEWGQGERKTYYHDLEMENGDKLNIGFKTQKQVGEELTYKFTDEVGQHEFTKAKTVNPEWENKQKGGFDVDGARAGHSVTGAIYLMTAGINILDEPIEKMKPANVLYKTSVRLAEITETVKNKISE